MLGEAVVGTIVEVPLPLLIQTPVPMVCWLAPVAKLVWRVVCATFVETLHCLLPSLWWENQSLVAIEAMINGIPVIGSDRGGIPETLGDAGIVLGLPARLTQATRELPTAEEVEPWVKAIIGLWDDAAWYADQSRRALAESQRWAPEVLEPQYVDFFRNLKPRSGLGRAAEGSSAS